MNFSQGDVVRFNTNADRTPPYLTDLEGIDPSFIKHGSTFFKENRGIVIALCPLSPHSPPVCVVEFEDRNNKMVSLGFEPQFISLYETQEKNSETQPPKSAELDLAPLDQLIIDPSVREEIVSVLKQHQHATKLFEEWGLGEMIKYGRGMTFLFYGPPGTGKTWASHKIAETLKKELLVINAADIQTSEPGGANRNIQQAFKSAKNGAKVLFLDECDSLITTRGDVGMIIGSEINTLLTEIEKFEGVCVLATNRVDTLDEALERRIALIVEFPEPNYMQRQDIWKTLLPKKMPLAKEVKVEQLSNFKLTGGQIKNVILQAARLAVSENPKAEKVEERHFETAIARIQKSKNLLGTASRWTQGITMDVGRRKIRSTDKVSERSS